MTSASLRERRAVGERGLFVIMGVALLLAVVLTGASLTQRVFRAIDNVVQQAQRIGESNLTERLPHPGPRDEIGRLVDTLNAMLARLESGFDAQRRFTADASHELRSPLSRQGRRPDQNSPHVSLAVRACAADKPIPDPPSLATSRTISMYRPWPSKK